MQLFRKYSLFSLALTVLVIVWGAYVRASGSGAGCGSHWPLCNGQIIPSTEREKTLIEFSHRLSSGILLILVVGLFLWAMRIFPKRTFAFKAAFFSLIAILMEALIGALLVLLRLVEQDQSVLRVFSISLHLVNTLFLLAALACTAFGSTRENARWRWPDRKEAWKPRTLLLGFVVLGALGAVAALGDTLFPPNSLKSGIIADFSSQAHIAERIRFLHPLLAVGWVFAASSWIFGIWEKTPTLIRLGKGVISLSILNLFLGLANILFLAPILLQSLHLFVANLLWIVFVWFILTAASSEQWQR